MVSYLSLAKRVDQQIDVVIEKLEVVGDFLVSADRGHQDDHLAAHIAEAIELGVRRSK